MDLELGLEQETTYDAGSTGKTPETPFKRETGASHGHAVADLEKLEADLTVELETALASGDAASIVGIREQLSRIPLMRTAAEIETTRNRLAEIEVELERAETKERLIRQVLAARRAELQAQIDALAPYQQAYQKCVYELGFVDNEKVLLRMERKEKKSRLWNLNDELKDGN